MIADTGRLFLKLLPIVQVDILCDVGSMDGAEALKFRERAPAATIYAFEALPRNLAAMRSKPALRDAGIETVPMAVTNFDGEAEFFAVEAGAFPGEQWRGMSSLHRRAALAPDATATRVATCRLDTFLAGAADSARLALWIDVEGKGYEVIEGAAGVLERVQAVHVEVESTPCIAATQKLYADIAAMLRSAGFEELARDRRADRPQFNVLYVRPSASPRVRFAMRWQLVVAGMRAALAAAARRFNAAPR